MIEQLVALAKIADIDAETLRADTELSEIPQRMGALQSDVTKLGELLAAEKQELVDADRLLQAQEDEINNSSQALARSKAKGARVRNTREADAVERELDTIRRLMKDREAERDSLREAISKRRVSVDKHEREFAELEKFAAEEQAKADARVAELTQVRERIAEGRGDLTAKVPADVLRRYEMIRSKRQGMGVAFGGHRASPPGHRGRRRPLGQLHAHRQGQRNIFQRPCGNGPWTYRSPHVQPGYLCAREDLQGKRR